MKNTGSGFEKYVYHLVKSSDYFKTLNGNIYRGETRPSGSELEDTVIIFSTALDGQTQEGVVNINIFVKDILNGQILQKDIKRCSEIEELCLSFFNSLKANQYKFTLGNVITTYEHNPKINQHFTNLKLNFKYNTLTP